MRVVKPKPEQNCGSCKYFAEYTENPNAGECHLHPPVTFVLPLPNPQPAVGPIHKLLTTWPDCEETD